MSCDFLVSAHAPMSLSYPHFRPLPCHEAPISRGAVYANAHAYTKKNLCNIHMKGG